MRTGLLIGRRASQSASDGGVLTVGACLNVLGSAQARWWEARKSEMESQWKNWAMEFRILEREEEIRGIDWREGRR